MEKLTRRKLITGGVATTVAGTAGLAAAARIASRYGLVPPDHGGLYGIGHTLTYASQRLITSHSLAREFRHDQISKSPFANGAGFKSEEYDRLKADSFTGWRMSVDGLVANPATFSLSDLRGMPARSQITHLACEEGWSFIAEWIGVPLADVLKLVGTSPQAKYVVYTSLEPGWGDSIDMADALHPQTFITYGMNGGDLPRGHGGPLRLRVPRQLGYKSVKYLARLTVTDSLKGMPAGGEYSWYAGM
jgi:DMSO/TMAO reductase YedYZ molybdopterin-dependent catalytic subunit